MRRFLVIALVGVVLVVGTGVPAGATTPEATTGQAARGPAPVFAYFYQWFDTASWDRAKSDYPLQGRYSSDDVEVLRGQVQTAKDAGITGFIVSWKSTEVNNRRLRSLIDVARAEDFSLAVIYQGLDFDRNPLPAQRVASDLRYFRDTFAADPVFRFRGRPLLIWSGTWRFSRADLESAVAPVRADVDVLASEKDTEGYARVADLVAGNAYYWSSVDPDALQGLRDSACGRWRISCTPTGASGSRRSRPASTPGWSAARVPWTGATARRCARSTRRRSRRRRTCSASSAGTSSARTPTSSPASSSATGTCRCSGTSSTRPWRMLSGSSRRTPATATASFPPACRSGRCDWPSQARAG